MATMAKNCGNICTSSMNSIPVRRPLKRYRENAKAAQAEMKSDRTEEISAMTMELKNQRAKLVVSKSLLKFSKLAFFGISADELSVPSGLKAEDTTNRMGKIAKNNATMPTICRQPTC